MIASRCRKAKANDPTLPNNHRYGTRFRLRACVSADASLSPSKIKVPTNDPASEDHVLVSCKRPRKDARPDICYLPKDTIFDILVHVPAQNIHQVMRYVCWEWYRLMKNPTFVTAHLQASPDGVIALHPNDKSRALCFHHDKKLSRIEVAEFRIPMQEATLSASYNGLVLFYSLWDHQHLLIVNLVTGVTKSLPPLGKSLPARATLACTSDGHYKVICVLGTLSPGCRFLVHTLGHDHGWRLIPVHSIRKSMVLLLNRGFCVGGFVYWLDYFLDHCFAWDVDAEVMHEFYPAKEHCRACGVLGYIKMEETIGMVGCCRCKSNKDKVVWNFWKLIDVKSSKWIKLFDIDMGAISTRLDNPNYSIYKQSFCYPFLCSGNGELWVRLYSREDRTTALAVINICNGTVMSLYQLDGYITCHSHLNSLVSPQAL